MFCKHLTLTLFACFTVLFLNAQEQIGLRTDNYSGINSIALNPAGSGASALSWDVNVFGFAQFFDNNYGYISNASLVSLMNPDLPGGDFIFAPNINPETDLDQVSQIVDFYNDGRRRYVYNHTALLGPSFFVKINDRHAIGLVTGARVLGATRGITDNLSYYVYDKRPFREKFSVDPFRAGLLTFGEIGLNYAYTQPTASGRFSIGITARYLTGFEGAYLRNATPFTMEKLSTDTVSGTPVDFRYAYTSSNLTSGGHSPATNGSGFSLDLGAIFTVGDDDGQYKWKFGFSLLDIGRVKFTENSGRHRVLTEESKIRDYNPFLSFNRVEDFEDKVISSFSEQLLGDAGASLEGNTFSVWLPSAFSAQVDYAVTSQFYLNALMIQGFPLCDGAIGRGSLLALSPRFDHKWFGASLPFSLYNYQRLRLGFSLRLAFFTIGTEYLGSYVGRSELTGSDLYFAVKLFPLRIGKSGGSAGFRKTRSGKNDAKCYQF